MRPRAFLHKPDSGCSREINRVWVYAVSRVTVSVFIDYAREGIRPSREVNTGCSFLVNRRLMERAIIVPLLRRPREARGTDALSYFRNFNMSTESVDRVAMKS